PAPRPAATPVASIVSARIAAAVAGVVTAVEDGAENIENATAAAIAVPVVTATAVGIVSTTATTRATAAEHTHITRCVVLDWIDQIAGFFGIANGALITCLLTGGVDAVGKKHDRFSTVDTVQVLIDHFIHRVIKTGASAYSGLQYPAPQQRAIVGRLSIQAANFVVERNHRNPVIRSKLVNESDCRILNLFHFVTG